MNRAVSLYNRIKELFADVEDGRHKALLLFRHFCGRSPFEFGDNEFPERENELLTAATRVAGGYPVQYALGEWPFMNCTLAVGEGVLIPRDDTVCVAEAALAAAKAVERPAVIDLCAGSGAIAAAVACGCPDAFVTAVELFDDAFAYLKKNLAPFSANALAVKADVFGFERTLAPDSVDVIVSNPPYIREDDYALLDETVKYEPKSALVGSGFYAYICKNYRAALKKGGVVVFEAGDGDAVRVAALLSENGYSAVEILPDDCGNPRVVRGVLD